MPAPTSKGRRLAALLFLTPCAAAQEGSDTPATEELGSGLQPADPVGWQALRQELFLSGESSLVDPGRLEPLPRNLWKLGPIELLPRFDEQLVYDDNLFLTEHDREQDFVLRTGLGLLGDWRFGQGSHRLSAGYDATRHSFLGGDADDFTEQLASAQLELRFRRLEIAAGARHEDRTDPLLSVFTGKIERTIDTGYGRLAWREEDASAELRLQRSTSAFDDAAFQGFDRDEDLASLELSRRTGEECFAFLRFDAMARTFDQDGLNDMDGFAASLGMRAKRGAELDGMARLGVRVERFDDSAPTDADDSAINPELEARVRWWLLSHAAIEARVEHTTEFSPVSNYQATSRGELTWMQQVESRMAARIGGGIEQVDPSNTDAPFTRWTLGAGLRYALLDNAELSLGWRLRLRQSRAATGDYTGNQITLGFSLRL